MTSKTRPDPSIALRTLLDSFYAADRSIKADTLSRLRTAIKRFAEFIGRAPTLAQVTRFRVNFR